MSQRALHLRHLLLCAILFSTAAAHAQHGGGGHSGVGFPGGGGFPGGPGFPGGISGGGPGPGGMHKGGPPPGGGPGMPGPFWRGLQLGPPGRWWDDKHFAKNVKLRPEQQRQMDATFEENRGNLLRCFENLQQEQSRMDVLTHSRTPDEASLYKQIDRLSQARADLEKANTRYLLQIRNAMDQDQISKLEQHQ